MARLDGHGGGGAVRVRVSGFLLCSFLLFSAFLGQPAFSAGISSDPIELQTPTLGKNSGYKLTQVAAEANNTITKYLESQVGSITPQYYAVNLANTEYGHKDNFDDVKYYKFDNSSGNVVLKDAQKEDYDIAYYVDSARLADQNHYSGAVDKDFVNIEQLRIATSNSLVSVAGDFIGNSREDQNGIAIINMQSGGYADSIVGNFINNTVTGNPYWGRGSILYLENGAKVDSFSGNFIGNSSISSSDNASGGVLFTSSGSIDAISGFFVANHAKGQRMAQGGALYISMSTVGTIVGDFINNYATTDNSAMGGAILVQRSSEITSITGDFIGNYIEAITGSAYGGAVYINDAKIGTITGDFINNYVSGNSAVGAAIHLTNWANLEHINGDFIGNIARGVIAANGGAISNSGATVLGEISGSFINNHTEITGTSNLALGGAIYTSRNLTISANNKSIEFTGNCTQDSRGTIPNAIFVLANSSASPTITLNATNNGSITLNDQIDGGNPSGSTINRSYSYTLALTGDNTSTIHINNEIINANITLNSTTLHLAQENLLQQSISLKINSGSLNTINNSTNPLSIPNLTLNGNLNYALDVNLTSQSADTLQITSATNPSNIHISEINTIGDIPTGQTASIIPFLTGNYSQNITTTLANELSTIYGQSYAYNVGISNQNLVFIQSEKIPGLPGALSDNGDRTFIMQSDESITAWVSNTQNSMQGNNLVIQGNNYAIIGNSNPGIIINPSQTLTIKNVSEISGFNSSENGAFLNNNAILNIIAENTDTFIQNNTANAQSNAIHNINATLNLNAADKNAVILNDKITSDNSSILNINPSNPNTPANGTIVINNDMSGFTGTVNLYNGTLKLGENASLPNSAQFNVFNGTLDLANNSTNLTTFNNLNIQGPALNLSIDADPANYSIDQISSSNTISEPGKINVTNINLLSDATEPQITLNFAENSLKNAVIYSGKDISYSNIYKYSVKYDTNTGDFTFSRYSTSTSDGFNPAVISGEIAQQGAFLSMLDIYQQAFNNFDMRLIQSPISTQIKLRNKFSSLNNVNYQKPHENLWFRPFTTFENVPLKNGPKVNNVNYGSIFGANSDLTPVKYGFLRSIGAYTGYIGSHQDYLGQSVYQNGGTLGFNTFFYKNNFFAGLTANTAAIQADAITSYGRDNITMLTAGIAAKSGYNLHTLNNKLIIQPNAQISYTFVNTFNYRTKTGLNINSDPLNAIQILPGIKIIGNLKNNWQPYITVSMVFNIMDKTNFTANQSTLPYLSVKPYLLYGIGVQKQHGERFTCYLQTLLRSGGRNGIGFSAGLKWKI